MEYDYYCDECGAECNRLYERKTESGQYCKECAEREKCACCGDYFHKDNVQWVEPVKNYLCGFCSMPENFNEAKAYIKPHYTLRTKSTALV